MLKIFKNLIVLGVFALFAFFPATVFGHGGDGEFRAEFDEDNEFEVRGMVDEVGDNFFTVTGFDQPIVLDPAMVEEFEVEGTLAVGAGVEAEGMVTDGTFFAEEVKVEGADDVDEDEDEDED